MESVLGICKSGLLLSVRRIAQRGRIEPGQVFEYESACPLQTSSGSMKGTYEMTSESGETFSIEVPEFFLIAPQSLH